MKKYFSNKYVKISCLNSLIKVLNDTTDLKEPNKLIIHTANGIYLGTLKRYDDSENYEIFNDDDIMTAYHKTYLKTLKETEIDKDVEHVIENPITITLEDVKVISSNLTTNLPYVDIFIDQIIGISFGSISSESQHN